MYGKKGGEKGSQACDKAQELGVTTMNAQDSICFLHCLVILRHFGNLYIQRTTATIMIPLSNLAGIYPHYNSTSSRITGSHHLCGMAQGSLFALEELFVRGKNNSSSSSSSNSST